MYNILVGGAAGDGIETMAGVFEKILKCKGFYLFSMRDFMSRVRGGHNFAMVRFGEKLVGAHSDALDGLVAFDTYSFEAHKAQLKTGAFVLCDKALDIQHENLIKLDIKGLAAQSGNPKTVGTVYAGALLKLFGISLAGAGDVLRANMKEKIVQANIQALQLGYDAAPERFCATPGQAQTTALLTGAEAMGLGALAGGIQFYAAYPMSPSTTLLEFFTEKSETFRIGVEQAEDEIAAANMALGASYAGARAMVGTSGGGFSLMVEALGFAGIAEIPVVFADVQRPGPATGLPTRTEQSDLLFVISASQGEFPRMVIAVRDASDAFYQTARAFGIAQKYQMPVILLSDQYLADAACTIPMPNAQKARKCVAPQPQEGAEAAEYLRYRITQSGISPLLYPGQTGAVVRIDSDEHDESGVITESAAVRNAMVEKRARKLDGLREELLEPDYVGAPAPQILLVGFGTTASALREAVEALNDTGENNVGALLFGDVYPLPTRLLKKYAAGAKSIVNVEQNATGQLASLLRREAMVQCSASLLKYDGRQMSVEDIIKGVNRLKKEGQL